MLVSKQTNSCFYGEPDLHGWLQERGISQLVLCGITTNHCCETTARMGGNLGYDVRFVLDATHTFNRGDLTADQLAHATSTNLNGEFATIVSTADVLQGRRYGEGRTARNSRQVRGRIGCPPCRAAASVRACPAPVSQRRCEGYRRVTGYGERGGRSHRSIDHRSEGVAAEESLCGSPRTHPHRCASSTGR